MTPNGLSKIRINVSSFFASVVLAGLLLSGHSHAVTDPHDEKPLFTWLDKQPGLTQNSINDIIQDSEGFIWLATLGGVHKYNGLRFERLSLSNTATHSVLQGGEVQTIISLFEDSHHHIWVGGFQGRVFKINKRSGEIVDFTLQIDPKAYEVNADNSQQTFGGLVWRFYEDIQGQIWIGSDHGIVRYNPLDQTFSPAPKFRDGPDRWQGVRDILPVKGHPQQIWLGTGTGLYRVDLERQAVLERYFRQSTSQPLSSNSITRLEGDENGLWIGTLGGGLNYLDHRSGKVRIYLSDTNDSTTLGSDFIRDLLLDDRDRLWVATQSGGLNRYDEQADGFVRYVKHKDERHGIPNNNLWSLFQDRSGVLWIGSAGSGLVQLVPSTRKFTVIESIPFDPDSLSDDFVWDLAFARNKLWAATLDGLNNYDPKTGKSQVYRHNISLNGEMRDNQLLSMDIAADGTLWIGTPKGDLLSFNFDTKRFNAIVQPAQGLRFSSSRIWYVGKDRENHLWMGTQDGTYRLSPEQQQQAYSGEVAFKPIMTQAIRTMYQDDIGRFWVGLNGSGLMVFDADLNLLQHMTNDPMDPSSLSHNTVRAITQDKFNNIWIGTHAGLNTLIRPAQGFIRNKFQHYYMQDGMPNDTVYSIVREDRYLWLATNRGLSRLDPQSGEFANYDISDGLPSNEFNGGAALRTDDGRLYFGGVNGISYFQSSRIIKNTVPPPVAISQVLVNNDPVGNPLSTAYTDELRLTHDQNNLTFRFASLDFHHPLQNQLRYRLPPYQNRWEDSTTGITKYANLPPGEYRFEVQGSNNDGVWADETRTLDIVISPPWYFHPVAYFFYFTLAALAFYRYRRSEIAQKQYLESMVFKRTEALATANRELAHSIEELEEAREAAEHANEMKSTFLANMSHEIRTPLTAIIGFTEHALDPNHDPAAQRDYLQRVLRSGQHLLRLINELLDLSKIEAEKLLLENDSVPLFDLMADIDSFARAMAQEKSLSFAVVYHYPLPQTLMGDMFRIRQVLYNLCGNAIKFTRQGSVAVHVEYKAKTRQINFSIRDTGIGMDSNEIKRLFQPFVQADSSITRQFGGSGLGLVISQKLVHLMRGDLTVESTKGEGSRFDVTLPTNQPEPLLVTEQPKIHRSELSTEEGIQLFKDAHVLVAEDNSDNQVLIELLLRPFGVQVTMVDNGVKAVESALLESYDLVLMDIQMPVMGGLEAVALMRNAGISSPVIALTANVMKEDIEGYLKGGFDATLAKPIQNKSFCQAINEHLGGKHAADNQTMDALIEKLKNGSEYLQLKARFRSDIPNVIRRFSAELDNRNWTLLKQQAHSIKGSAASMGFPELTRQAAQIERLLANEQFTNAEAATTEFIQICESLLAETKDDA